MHIIWIVILVLIIGAIARVLVPGREHLDWLATAGLGIVGAYVGGTLGSIVFAHHFTLTPPIKHSVLGAIIGAVIVLLIYRVVVRNSSRP